MTPGNGATNDQLTAARFKSWMASWRQVINDRLFQLDVARRQARRTDHSAAINMAVQNAKLAARLDGQRLSPFGLIGQWVTGSAVEAAWRGLHFAEQEFVLDADEQWVLARVTETQATLHALGLAGGPATSQAQRTVLEIKDKLHEDDRKALKATLTHLNGVTDGYHTGLRTLRNILLGTLVLLLGALVAFAAAAAASPNAFSLCGVPAPARCIAPSVADVEIAGFFGGLLSAVVFLRNLPTQATPYAISLFQGLLKAPVGAALAVIVVFLVQTGLLGALKAAPGYVIPYALVFGFAQQLATQFIDNWASGLVEQATGTKARDHRAKPASKS